MNEILDKPAKKTTRKRAGKRTTAKGAAKTTAGARAKGGGKAQSPANVTPERRLQMIAEAAYFRAEARGFAPGHEMEDWLAAEAEVDRLLSGGSRH